MKFTKMHGIGNDYVYVDCTKKELKDPAEISKIVSDRHFGIGSDGLILIGSSDRADFRMNIYNADGSQAEMCGNGIRCVAKYVYDYGLTEWILLPTEPFSPLLNAALALLSVFFCVASGSCTSFPVCSSDHEPSAAWIHRQYHGHRTPNRPSGTPTKAYQIPQAANFSDQNNTYLKIYIHL